MSDAQWAIGPALALAGLTPFNLKTTDVGGFTVDPFAMPAWYNAVRRDLIRSTKDLEKYLERLSEKPRLE